MNLDIDCCCVCGHDIWAHAKHVGEACDHCDCEGWKETIVCTCKSLELFNFGCRCGAFLASRPDHSSTAKKVSTADIVS